MATSKVKVSAFVEFPLSIIPKKSVKLNRKAVVRVEAPAVKSHISIDLVVVLDVMSSSIALDVLKKAMKFIIKHLDNDDYLNIVTFDNCTEISRKDWAYAEKVDELVALGHIGSKSGLEEAVKILDARSDKMRQGFIILVSDSSGESDWSADDPARASLEKYPVHTMSLGKAQDPRELVFIAKESNGTYSSIPEDLNSKIMEAFALCLAGLKSVFASDTRVTISRPEGSSSPIPSLSSWNLKRINCTGLWVEGESHIALGVLYAGEVKDLVVEIELTAAGQYLKGFHSIYVLTATVDYKDVKQKIQSVHCKLELKVCATSVATKCTNEYNPLPMVVQQDFRFKVLKFMDEFRGTLYDIKGVSLQYKARRNLEILWEKEFPSWKESQEIMGVVDLGRIHNDIDAMVSCLKRGLGLGCVYSWVLSYKMQRATTTGLPTTPAFLTPAMKEMVHRARTQSAQAAGSTQLQAPPGEGFVVGNRIVEGLEHIFNSLEDMASKLDRVGRPSTISAPEIL